MHACMHSGREPNRDRISCHGCMYTLHSGNHDSYHSSVLYAHAYINVWTSKFVGDSQLGLQVKLFLIYYRFTANNLETGDHLVTV